MARARNYVRPVDYRVLGPVEVLADGVATALGGPKQRGVDRRPGRRRRSAGPGRHAAPGDLRRGRLAEQPGDAAHLRVESAQRPRRRDRPSGRRVPPGLRRRHDRRGGVRGRVSAAAIAMEAADDVAVPAARRVGDVARPSLRRRRSPRVPRRRGYPPHRAPPGGARGAHRRRPEGRTAPRGDRRAGRPDRRASVPREPPRHAHARPLPLRPAGRGPAGVRAHEGDARRGPRDRSVTGAEGAGAAHPRPGP